MAETTTPTERAIRDREKRSRSAYAKRTRRAERAAVVAAEAREFVLAEETGADKRHKETKP